MKIFPEKEYFIELNKNMTSAIPELDRQTLPKEQFVTNWNNQTFIGKVDNNKFEIKLSQNIIGEFCVLNGEFKNENKGVIKIRTGKILKLIFSAIAIYIILRIISAIIRNQFELIAHFIITILVMRFIFLELGFRFASKNIMKKLTEIIGIKNSKNKVRQKL